MEKADEGIEAIKQIRKNPKFEKLVIILHYGRDNEQARQLRAGYLKKPYSFEEFKKELEVSYERTGVAITYWIQHFQIWQRFLICYYLT